MPTTALDLGTLIAPFDQETFFRDYWEQQPLLISRGAAAHYDGLLASADVDQVVAFTRPRFDDPGAFTAEPPRESSYVRGRLPEHPGHDATRWADGNDVRRAYGRGKTVVIMGMQQRWMPIAALCRELESVFFCPVHANMYLTPDGAQGFDAHFDTHEVFVLQLEGSKHWRVYGAPRPLPGVEERFNLPKDELGPPREVRLDPGDLLYLPRGFVHEAFTSECHSLHLTVGVNVYRWSDLLHEALADLAARDSRFRASVPAGALRGSEPAASFASQFRELLGTLAHDACLESALESLGSQFVSSLRPLPVGPFFASRADGELDADTLLERRSDMVCRVVQEGRWVEIQFPGGRVGGPPKIAAALRFVACTERFRVRDLPDELGNEGKVVLARRLVHERLLNVGRGPSATPSNGSPVEPVAAVSQT